MRANELNNALAEIRSAIARSNRTLGGLSEEMDTAFLLGRPAWAAAVEEAMNEELIELNRLQVEEAEILEELREQGG